jgi:hypothetical protein
MRSAILASALLLTFTCAPGCNSAREALKARLDALDARGAEPPAAAALAPPAGVAFTVKAPAEGDKAESTALNDMTLEASVALGKKALKMSVQTTETEARTEEVLAAAGGAVQKLRVTYTAKTNVMKEGKRERKLRNPLAGKTFVVEVKDGKVTAVDAKAKPVKGSALKLLAAAYETLGKPDPMAAALPKAPLAKGQKVDALARAVRESLSGKSAKGMTVGDVTVTFKDKEGDLGVFDVTAKVALVEKPMKFDMELKGQMGMRLADGQPASLTLEGPVTASSSDKRLKMEGTGTMKMSMTRKKI